MQVKARDVRLFERTDETGDWGTITGLNVEAPDIVHVTVTGWRSHGEPFIDTARLHSDDLITATAPEFISLLVDLYGHLITDTSCRAA